jgi:glycosyltransferase involved in cell wall biosynthesis
MGITMQEYNQKIKVGFIVDDIDRRAMGTALYMQRLIDQLVKNHSHEIELVLISREGKGVHPVCRLARHIEIPTFKLQKFSGVFSFMRWFFMNKEEFDIIHYPRPKLYPFFWVAKTKKNVVTFHDAPEKGSPRFRTPANYFWEWTIKLWFHKYIDAALGASHYSAKTIWEYYHTDKDKTFGIQNGGGKGFFPIDEQKISSAKDTLAEKYKIPFPYILQATRFVPHKNPHRQIQAFGILKKKYNVPHKLVIMGGGSSHDPEFDKVVNKAIEVSGAKDDIFIAPFIDDEDMNALYNCADLFIQAGTSDGFSIPIADALSAGLPIVTSDRSVFPEMVGEAGVLADPFNPDSMAEAMHKILSDNDFKASLSQKALEQAKLFTWERMSNEMVGIYRKTLTKQQ